MGLRSMLGDQRGFTIIEVMVAATLLVIGVLGTMAMVDSSNAQTRLSGGREGATNLAREVVEGARSIGYDELLPASVNPRLQALPGLASLSGTTWTVKRRGITYTISTSLCSVDDPKDGYGSHAGASYCADSSSTGTTDAQAEDFKRLMVDVSWPRNAGTQSLRQVALIDSPASKGPRVAALIATNATPQDAPKITSPTLTPASFKATAPPGVDSMVYSLDGVDKGSATKAANGTDWTFDIPLPGSLSDGGYDVSVRAADARGVVGPSFSIPMTLIRSAPAAPSGLVGGPNTIYVGGAPKQVTELEWNANSERNVIGYRVYNAGSTLVCPASAQTLSLKLSCIDQTVGNGGTYTVRALYRNAADVVTEGPSAPIPTDQTGDRTFYFKGTTPSSGTNCGAATSQQDMQDAFPGSNPESTFFGSSTAARTLNFCSAPLPAGVQLRAGPATVNGYFENTGSGNRNCDVTGRLYRNGTATPLNTAGTRTIPRGSATQAFPLSMGDVSNVTFAAGERLNMVLTLAQSQGCDVTSLHYGGTTNRSSLTVSANQIAPPNPPTGLSATTLADGMTQLSWAAPAAGNPVSFYRIYRDGIDYTNRIDTTGSGTETTYVDDPGGTTHSYRVTSVSENLAESTMAGPVTK